MTTLTQLANEYQFKNEQERKNALQSISSLIQKNHGKESMTILDSKVNLNIPNIPSEILSLDLALGIGGLPKGRIIEFYGDNSAGKTTLSLNFIKQTQRRGGLAAFIDVEHAFDRKWAKFNGVNIDELLFAQPSSGEEALEIVDDLVVTNQVGIIVVDSVAALVPKAELEKDMGESSMGLQARLMSQAMRKLTGSISKSGAIVIFLNQTRDKIGGYGSPTTTTGGNALKFYASVRFDIARKETLKKGEEAYGVKTRVKIVKNKVASPFTECYFDLIFKEGYDYEGSVIEEAVKYGFIKKGGAWYTYKEEKFQGLLGIKAYLKSNPELITVLRQQVLEKVSSEGLSDVEVNLTDEEPKKRTPKDITDSASATAVESAKEQKELPSEPILQEAAE